MRRYRYKGNTGITTLLLLILIWFLLWFIPDIIKQTGREVFPSEPEETYQIIEPAVMSTKMIEAERESREQAEAKAEVLTETQYIAMTMEVAAYAPLDNKSGICADESPLTTANDVLPKMGTVACNPSIIPYGTRLFIPGYGFGVAEDTGAIVRERTDLIEVFMPTYEEAMEWGRKENITVFVEVEE